MRPPRGRTAYALLFLALFVPFSYFNHNDGWNQGVRIAELHALVVKGTLRIDDYLAYTGDRALIDGHYYSEKAPAMVFLALPSFALTVAVQKMLGVDPDSPPASRVSGWIATAASVGLLTAVGGVAFFALLMTRFDTVTAVVATFGLFLGSITWPYATSLFAHAGTIGLMAIALWGAIGPASPRRDVLAGLAAGFAVASEYPAIFPGAVIGLYLARLDPRRMWRYGLAALPAAALILINNYAISGSPFKLSYGSNPLFPELAATTSYGFSTPEAGAIRGLLWGEYRGLFFWSPLLLMSVPGFYYLFRKDRGIAVMTMIGCVLVLLQAAAFYTWFGGNAIGPRYLAPVMPFVGLAAAYGIQRWPEPGLVLALISIAVMLGVTAIAIDPPGDVMTPLQSFYLVRLREQRFADNLGTLLGAPVWLSLIVPLLFPAVAAWQWLKEPRTGV
jgi:MFS family permease